MVIGLIIGIVVGSTVVIAILFSTVIYCVRKRAKVDQLGSKPMFEKQTINIM